jgi:hypothetical protein
LWPSPFSFPCYLPCPVTPVLNNYLPYMFHLMERNSPSPRPRSRSPSVVTIDDTVHRVIRSMFLTHHGIHSTGVVLRDRESPPAPETSTASMSPRSTGALDDLSRMSSLSNKSFVFTLVSFVRIRNFQDSAEEKLENPCLHNVIVTKKHPIWLPSHRFPARTTTQVCHMLAVVCQRRQTQRATSASTLSSSFQGQ